jgi:L-alanine-DL-glutamate epimerase-like enolase superfamily enzyme
MQKEPNMTAQRITEISVTPVKVAYRKELGRNSNRENIGANNIEWLVRARTDGGLEGLTIANRYMRVFNGFLRPMGRMEGLMALLQETFIGKQTDEFLEMESGVAAGVKPAFQDLFKKHGWMNLLAFDLAGRDRGVSCVDMLGGRRRDTIDAYDTTIWHQDMVTPENAAKQEGEDAAASYGDGYRQFKIKVGRGGRWMLPKEGMQRDVEVVLAVREAVGPDCKIMVDANFGYDGHMDLLEDFVRETLPANLFWLEEMVTADVVTYRHFRSMRDRLGCQAMLVCGEVDFTPISPIFADLMKEGLIDGFQPDTVTIGFSTIQAIGGQLESAGVQVITHNFNNGNFGTRANIVFGAASNSNVALEDERYLPNVYKADGFVFQNGAYTVVDAPGMGLEVDENAYQRLYAKHEIKISL